MTLTTQQSAFLRTAQYYLTAGSFMLAGLMLTQIFQWMTVDIPKLSSDGITWFTPPVIYLLSLPPIFLFWIYRLHEHHAFTLTFSPIFAILSVVSFVIANSMDMKTSHMAITALTLLGCIAGGFVFINWREFKRYAFRNERITCVALLGASASGIYSLMDKYMWQKMAYSAAQGSQWVLEIFDLGTKVGIAKQPDNVLATMLTSDNFSLFVYQPCSGLEGIFLFIFLLSIVLLMDWPMLQRIDLIETYLIGFIFMYAANILRIVSLFLLGHFAHAPDASPLLASMRGLPIHIFHSFVGQIYYIFAFMIFTHLLYAYITPDEKIKNAG